MLRRQLVQDSEFSKRESRACHTSLPLLSEHHFRHAGLRLSQKDVNLGERSHMLASYPMPLRSRRKTFATLN